MSQAQGVPTPKPKPEAVYKVSPLDKSTKSAESAHFPYVGQVQIVVDSATNKHLLLKENVYNTEEEFVVGVLIAQKKKTLRNDGLLFLIDYSAEKVSNFCSSFYKVKYYYLPLFKTLSGLSKDRIKQGKQYTEQELTYLLFHTVSGLTDLHKAGLTHKQITPEAIDTTNLEGRNPKLIHHEDASSGQDIRSLSYSAVSTKKELYLAPEIFQRIPEIAKKSRVDFDEQKADSFSLGLTLLWAGLGQSVQNCYEPKTFTFNQSNLINHISQFKAKFSNNPLLTDSLERLLAVDVNSRTTPANLLVEIPPVEDIDLYFEVDSASNNNQDNYNLIYRLSGDDIREGEVAGNFLATRLYKPSGTSVNFDPSLRKGPEQPAGQSQQQSNGQVQGGQVQYQGNQTTQQQNRNPTVNPAQQPANLPSSFPVVPGPPVVASPPIASTTVSSGQAQVNQSSTNPWINQNSFGNWNNAQPVSQSGFLGQGANPLEAFTFPSSAARAAQTVQSSRVPPQQDDSVVSKATPTAIRGIVQQQQPEWLGQNATRAAPAASVSKAGPVVPNRNIFPTSTVAAPQRVQTTTAASPVVFTSQFSSQDSLKRSVSQPVLTNSTDFSNPQRTYITGQQTVAAQVVTTQNPPTQVLRSSSSQQYLAGTPSTGSTYGYTSTSYQPLTTYHTYQTIGQTVPAFAGSHSISHSTLPVRGGFSPLQVVHQPATAVTGLSESEINRTRSSSHNIVRGGTVVDRDNPNEELRASRIVVSRGGVDFHVDSQQTNTVNRPSYTTIYQTQPSPVPIQTAQRPVTTIRTSNRFPVTSTTVSSPTTQYIPSSTTYSSTGYRYGTAVTGGSYVSSVGRPVTTVLESPYYTAGRRVVAPSPAYYTTTSSASNLLPRHYSTAVTSVSGIPISTSATGETGTGAYSSYLGGKSEEQKASGNGATNNYKPISGSERKVEVKASSEAQNGRQTEESVDIKPRELEQTLSEHKQPTDWTEEQQN